MPTKHFLLLLSAFSCSLAGYSQNGRLGTDRPGESLSAQTVERKAFQAELGFRKEQVSSDASFYYHPRSNLRWGVANRFELRAELAGTTAKQGGSGSQTGLEPVELGLKAQLLKGNGALPTTSLYAQLGFPKWASKEFQRALYFPKLRLLMESEVSEKVLLVYNVGAEWQGKMEEPEWVATFQPQWKIGKKWDAFGEYYVRTHSDTHPEHVLDGGLCFYPGKNLKLDAAVGKGLSQGASDYFVAVGLSFRAW